MYRRQFSAVVMNTGNDTIYSLPTHFSCHVKHPNGKHDYVACSNSDGIISGEYKQEMEGLYQLIVKDFAYQIKASIPVLVDRSRANRIHMEVVIPSSLPLDFIRP